MIITKVNLSLNFLHMHYKNPDTLIDIVRKTLRELEVALSSQILIGVSGGIDSMVLLHILKSLNYSIAASHINFSLRGNESDEDALLVRRWCSEHAIPYFENRVDTKAYAVEHKLNTQLAAREIRYEWWKKLVTEHPFDYVATAHHLDDAIETFFINLFRGTGLKGLRGIPMKRDHFIRPLLRVSRSDIESYATKHEIPFRVDSSNETDDYQRNRIRHHLIPALKDFMPDPNAVMDQTLHRIRAEWESWEQGYHLWIATNVDEENDHYLISSNESDHAFLLRWLEEKGFPWQLSYDYVKASPEEKGKSVAYNDYRLSRTRDGFHLESNQSFQPFLIPQPGVHIIGDDAFSIETVPIDSYLNDHDPFSEYIDASGLHWPLELRSVIPGDQFQPIGMNGKSKKLQDFLVDLKLDSHEKKQIKVLTMGEQIIWVVGKRLDERFKIKPDSKEALKLTYKTGAI